MKNKVTWLEATIACPIFTGLIVYYVEGAPNERGHLMNEPLANSQRSWSVRGNVFSFMLPWETVMAHLSRAFAAGDFSQWPLDQDTAATIVRLRMIRGHEALVSQFKELRVRSQVVKGLANLYVDNQLTELLKKKSITGLLASKIQRLREQFREHISRRVDAEYPSETYGNEQGAVPEYINKAVAASTAASDATSTNFDLKPSTYHDLPKAPSECLSGQRPTIVAAESTTKDALPEEVVVEKALNKVTGMTVNMGHKFEDQFHGQYMSRIFPWALNYSCGGADYPDLFTNWESSSTTSRHPEKVWRKTHDEAVLRPGPYAQMLATRCEAQVAGDWMLVPSARNLHWRYEVLHSAFVTCKQRLSPDTDMKENLDSLLKATKFIWERISKNQAKIKGAFVPINGRTEMLFQDDELDNPGKLVLSSYLNTTKYISG